MTSEVSAATSISAAEASTRGRRGLTELTVSGERSVSARAAPVPAGVGLRKAHSHQISAFVANAAEVHRHFIAADYPTFAEVMRKHKVTDVASLIVT